MKNGVKNLNFFGIIMLNHRHLILNGFIRRVETDIEWAKNFLLSLVDRIGMKVKVGLIAGYCDVEGNTGLTAAVCIETSHCSLHIFDQIERPYLRLDIYSCANFDEKVVIDYCDECLELLEYDYLLLDRNFVSKVISQDYTFGGKN